jgi:glycosyltransferase involved in cell wall biosynthesis
VSEELRVGLVHDYLLVFRGAERTFAAISDMWPRAPIHTLLYDDRGTEGRFRRRDVRPSVLQALGIGQDRFRKLLPIYPTVASRLPVQDYDLVVSSSSAFAHGVRPRDGAVHVCYCHSPFRYAWHERRRALQEVPAPLRPALDVALRRHRNFDRRAARSVTVFIANSAITRERIRRFWGRTATVIYPPVHVERFALEEPEDYYLLVGELVAHKRPELALEAARRARRRLVVVGTGPELHRLHAEYGATAEFVGRVDDATLAKLYARSRALVVPNVEEFGITAVEAQAAGRPVIGVDAGGVRETVVHGRTGWLLPRSDVDVMARVLRRDPLDGPLAPPHEIRDHAQRFCVPEFERRLRSEISAAASQLR